MNDIWPEIVEILQPYFSSNVAESSYQNKIEDCLRLLGWKTTNNTMQSQYVLPIGNNNNIRPDIVLFKPDPNTAVLPIEIKRPNNIQCERQVVQLKTYVRQLNLKVGLYIGEKIDLYYNSENGDFINVFTTKIQKDDINGFTLCNLLLFHSFDLNKLESFCKSLYQEIKNRDILHKRLTEFFSQENALNNTMCLLKSKFIKDGFDSELVDEEFLHLSVTIKYEDDKLVLPVEVNNNINDIKQKDKEQYHKDKTRFSFNGSVFYNKRRFVLEVIKHYINEHPYISFNELKQLFPDELHSRSIGVIRLYSELLTKIKSHPDVQKRYFLKSDEIITLYDGTKIVVTNQWGNFFYKFLNVAKTLYEIKSNKPY